jgi:hypothetical protein
VSTRTSLAGSLWLPRTTIADGRGEAGGVLEETSQTEEIVERVAALDVGKAELACCVRVPGRAGKRLQEVTTHKTMTRSLLVLADRLATLGVPGWCWRPPATTGRAPLAPRGSTYPGGGERTPPAACRSRPLKLGQPDPGRRRGGWEQPRQRRDGSAPPDDLGPASKTGRCKQS